MKIWSRPIAQNINEKFEKFCPEQNFQIFSFLFWAMRQLHIFILKFIDLLMKNHTQGDQNQPRQTNNYLDLNLGKWNHYKARFNSNRK